LCEQVQTKYVDIDASSMLQTLTESASGTGPDDRRKLWETYFGTRYGRQDTASTGLGATRHAQWRERLERLAGSVCCAPFAYSMEQGIWEKY
jgi:hypothetical protein